MIIITILYKNMFNQNAILANETLPFVPMSYSDHSMIKENEEYITSVNIIKRCLTELLFNDAAS